MGKLLNEMGNCPFASPLIAPLLSKDSLEMSMRDCISKVYIYMSDQRKKNKLIHSKRTKMKKRKNIISVIILSIKKKYKRMRNEEKKDV